MNESLYKSRKIFIMSISIGDIDACMEVLINFVDMLLRNFQIEFGLKTVSGDGVRQMGV